MPDELTHDDDHVGESAWKSMARLMTQRFLWTLESACPSGIVESIKEPVRAAKLGRKSGVGFYEYDDDGNVVH